MVPLAGEVWWGRLIKETEQFPILVLSASSRADFEGLYYEESRGRLLTISGEMSQACLTNRKSQLPAMRDALFGSLSELKPDVPVGKDPDETDIMDPILLDPDSEYDHFYGHHRIAGD